MYLTDSNPHFTPMEVKLVKNFFEELRKESRTSIKQLCINARVSTRTYAKILKLNPVKSECYHRLLIGITYSANDEEFLHHWHLLGQQFYFHHNP